MTFIKVFNSALGEIVLLKTIFNDKRCILLQCEHPINKSACIQCYFDPISKTQTQENNKELYTLDQMFDSMDENFCLTTLNKIFSDMGISSTNQHTNSDTPPDTNNELNKGKRELLQLINNKQKKSKTIGLSLNGGSSYLM